MHLHIMFGKAQIMCYIHVLHSFYFSKIKVSHINRVSVKYYPFDWHHFIMNHIFFRWSHFGNTEMVIITCFKKTGFPGSSVCKALCDKNVEKMLKVSVKCQECQEFKVSKQSGHPAIVRRCLHFAREFPVPHFSHKYWIFECILQLISQS